MLMFEGGKPLFYGRASIGVPVATLNKCLVN